MHRFRTLVAPSLLTLVCSGCVLNADLTAEPYQVSRYNPIEYKVKVTNPLECPVGGVIAFLFPLVPKDHFISKIEDEEFREHVSNAVDAFCADGTVDPGAGAVKCELVSGELVCEIETGSLSPNTAVALANSANGDEVTCQSGGNKITCRIPQRLVEQGYQTAAQSTTSDTGAIDLFPFQCNREGGLFVCGAAYLGAGEMKMDAVQVTATQPGEFRNFVVMFAARSGGVCKTGILPGVPCGEDSQCPDPAGAAGPDCGNGICDGGKQGFGCDSGPDCTATGLCLGLPGQKRCVGGRTGATCTTNGDCTATGTCVQCDSGGDGLLPGLACENSLVVEAVQAPAMAPWSLAGTAAALVAVAVVQLRRRRRRRA